MRGFINILKPSGMTSSDVVVKVRGILRRAIGEKQKVGHLGTLDPMGTGVLPIAVGTATRLFDLLSTKRKTYIATFRFSEETDTLDSSGKIVAGGGRIPSKCEIERVLHGFIGEIDQIPPQYSAKSIDGKRAYQYARQGEQVELKPKKINIYSNRMLAGENEAYNCGDVVTQTGTGEFAFEIVCGSGTYIRSIARDLALKLDTYAHMTSIRRTDSGMFDQADGVCLQEFEQSPLEYILSVESVLKDFPFYELPPETADKVLNGVEYYCDTLPQTGVFVVTLAKSAVGIAVSEDGKLKFLARL